MGKPKEQAQAEPQEETQPQTAEDKIAELKLAIKTIREAGSFKAMYKELRTKSVGIMRDSALSQDEKKEALATLCIKIADDFKTGVQNE